MKYAWLTLFILATSCDTLSLPPVAAMPWVRGLNVVAVSEVPTQAATQRISDLRHATAEDGYGAIELRADVTGDASAETVLVSHRLGVVVVDSTGHLMASAPGFDFSGSADELVSVAVGDGHVGAPVIAVAVQAGGHRESTILLSLYQVQRGKLALLFAAPIEEHDGAQITAGSVTLVPSGLIYRPPGARTATRWTFDERRRRYIEKASDPDPPLPGT